MVYLQATMKVKAGKLPEFISLFNRLIPVLGKRGWKLVGSYRHVVGLGLNTIVDLWELPDANSLATVLSDPNPDPLTIQIRELTENGTAVLMTKLPIE